MHYLRAVFATIGLGLLPSLLAQTPTPASARPSAGDLREEQRTIGNAYLGDAEFQIKRARERLGSENNRLAQQSGLWALEQIAYAKRRLERHAPRIEQVRGFFPESTRKDLRASYAKVRERYVDLEEKLDLLAQSLAKVGLPILGDTLNNVRSSTGEAAVAAAHQGLARAGEQAQGDKAGGESGSPNPSPEGAVGGGAAAGTTVGLGNSGLKATVGPDGVTIGQTTIPGIYDPATQKVSSPQYGEVDLKSAQTNDKGVTFLQTDKGVLVIPPGILAPGARLNRDGTITLADGTQAPINDVAVTNGQLTAGGGGGASNYSGGIPPNTQLVGPDGRPITVDGDAPPFQNGERSFVRKVYLGVRDTILQRETKVTQRLTEVAGTTWRVSESLGESRSWSLRTGLSNTQTGSGKLTGIVTVTDAGGSGEFTVSNLDVQDDNGQRASVEHGVAGSYTVTFTKSGDYTATAVGTTNWGSRFRIEATFPIGVR